MKKSEKPFKPALDYNKYQLALCLDKIAAQQALLAKIKQALPYNLAIHAQHCVISGSTLLLYTDAASWASQMRFFQPAILNKLHEAGQSSLSRLQIRVTAQFAEPAKRTLSLPSAENIELICADAARHPKGDELTAALSRLGSTLKRRLQEDRSD